VQNDLGAYSDNRRASLLREEKKDIKRGERKKERQSERCENPSRESTSILKNDTARCSYNGDTQVPSCLETLKALNVTSPNKRVPSKDSLTSKQSAQIDQTLSNYLETLKSKRNNIKSSSFLKKFVNSNSSNNYTSGSYNNNTGSLATSETTNLPDNNSNTSGTAYTLSDMMKRFLQESSESKTPLNPKRYAHPGMAGFTSDYSSAIGGSSNPEQNADYSGYKSVNTAFNNPILRSSDHRSPLGHTGSSKIQRGYDNEVDDLQELKKGPIPSETNTLPIRNSSKYLQVNTDFIVGGIKEAQVQKNNLAVNTGKSENVIPLDNLALLQKGFHDIYKRESTRKSEPKHLEIEETKARSVPATTRHSTSGSNPLANIFLNYSTKSPTKCDLDTSPSKSPVISKELGFSLSRPNRQKLELMEIFTLGDEGYKPSESLGSEANQNVESRGAVPIIDELINVRLIKGLALTPTNSSQATRINFNKKSEKPNILESEDYYESWSHDNRRISSDSFNVVIESASSKNISHDVAVLAAGEDCIGKGHILNEGKNFHNYEIAAQPSNQPSQRSPRIVENKGQTKIECFPPNLLKVEEINDCKGPDDELDSVLVRVKGILDIHSQKENAWRIERDNLLREVEMLRGRVKELEGLKYY
jgi:hypothetical protein